MEAQVEIGGHVLRFRMPSVPARLAFTREHGRALAESAEASVTVVYAALQACWDPAAGEPPWGAVSADYRAAGLAIADATGRWDCGPIAVYNLADALAAEVIQSVQAPPRLAEAAKATADFSGPPKGRGSSTGGGRRSGGKDARAAGTS